MKRLVVVLSGLLVLPAFAEVMPVFYDDEIEYVDGDVNAADVEFVSSDTETNAPADAPTNVNVPVKPATAISPRNASTRPASRAVASTTNNTSSRTNTATGRNVATRAGTTSRSATNANTVSQRNNVVSRAATARATTTAKTNSVTTATPSRAVVAARAGSINTGTTTSRRGTSSTSTANTARAGTTPLIQTDTVNTPLYTGRVGVRGSATTVSSRVPTTRAASVFETTTTTTTDTTSLDELAQLTDFCKAQYMQCMDNFCNVLDDNQGRCSCSANLKNYEKIEAALKQATTDLQTVAQNIQYIGLTADQVSSLFQQTEAEAEMQGKTDTSQLKSDLDKIKGLIVDVKSGSSTSTSTSGISMDLSGLLDFSIDSTGFDLSSLFSGMTTNTNSITNQRGEQLYKTAAARCKSSVLNSCTAQGVDASVITNSYDLEIDKQCMAYERALTDANDQMRSTVTNAQNLLQRARLMVAQQKNAYDLRGCVTALDECMQDDFVCGDNYENCLDPSGRYIVNGEIVVGSTPGKVSDTATDGLYTVWGTGDSAWSSTNTLSQYIEKTLGQSRGNAASASGNMSYFLQDKIGYIEDNKTIGMCAGVLNQCQDYTFKNGKYDSTNTVVKEFLSRAMMQIKAAQDTLLSEYAQDCPTDVKACLSRNSYSTTITSSSQLMSVAIASCSSIIKTCMSVNDDNNYNTPEGMLTWVNKLNLAPTCPDGANGIYPRCICTGGKAYMADTNECITPPQCSDLKLGANGAGLSDTWPNCTGCADSKTFDPNTNTCK